MGRWMRYLIMFGPMLFRMFNKWQAKRNNAPRQVNQEIPPQKEGEANPKYKDRDVKYDGDEFV